MITGPRMSRKDLEWSEIWGSEDIVGRPSSVLFCTQVFLKPGEGAREGGVAGFFAGAAQGLLGAAVKPVVGVLDGANASTCVKNKIFMIRSTWSMVNESEK